ncbi:amino acid ABC transporter substrate-binding protein [Chitinimonas arctica]|uniref:Amino acid ABC transporter substrate-binding protein n=1 Tax=Chitinimonas arctica TaxID=2594795 RepID=A0A516SEF0_9NEIS|nr:transporter substrate-binding domain-containing protein [Chitinimonas arctica]QDQ26535.1 amino acid ABC transporter substrate-binding protein [Chitinimonas arctica]
MGLRLFFGWLAMAAALYAQAAEPVRLRLVTDEWRPYEYVEHGQVKGYSIDKLRAVLRNMDVELVLPTSSIPWKRLLAVLAAGEADVAVNGALLEADRSYLRFPATPLTDTHWRMFMRRAEAASYKSRADLEGKTAGLVHGWAYVPAINDFIRDHGRAVVSYDQHSNFRRLLAGQVDYVIEERHVGQHLINRAGWQDGIAMAPAPGEMARFYALFSRKTVSAELVERFDTALKAFQGSAEDLALRQRYGIAPP